MKWSSCHIHQLKPFYSSAIYDLKTLLFFLVMNDSLSLAFYIYVYIYFVQNLIPVSVYAII